MNVYVGGLMTICSRLLESEVEVVEAHTYQQYAIATDAKLVANVSRRSC